MHNNGGALLGSPGVHAPQLDGIVAALVEENEEMLINLARWERQKTKWLEQTSSLQADLDASRAEAAARRADCEKLRAAFAELAKNAEAATAITTTQQSDEESLLSTSGAREVGAASSTPHHEEDLARIRGVHRQVCAINKTNFSVFCGDVPKLVLEILHVVRSLKPDGESVLSLSLDVVEQLAMCLSWACGAHRGGAAMGGRDVTPPPQLGPLPDSPLLLKPSTHRGRGSFELPVPASLQDQRPPVALGNKLQSLSSLDAALPSPQPTPRSSVAPPAQRAALPRGLGQDSRTATTPRPTTTRAPPIATPLPLPLPVPTRAGRATAHNNSSPAPRLLLDDDVDPVHSPAVVVHDVDYGDEPARIVTRRRTTPMAPIQLPVAPLPHRSPAVSSRPHAARHVEHAPSTTPPPKEVGVIRERERTLTDISPNNTPPLKRYRQDTNSSSLLNSPSDLVMF